MLSRYSTRIIDTVLPTCSNCGGTCGGCDGNGLVLLRQAVDICPRCAEYSEIENGEQRAWCPDCHGCGFVYEQLIVCGDCAGDGYCLVCESEVFLGAGI
jgi:hypothetical protein